MQMRCYNYYLNQGNIHKRIASEGCFILKKDGSGAKFTDKGQGLTEN